MKKLKINRRQFLQGAASTPLGLGASSALSACFGSSAQAQSSDEPPLLIVFGAAGGASIIDSLLAFTESEAEAQKDKINCYPDAVIKTQPGSPFRAIDLTDVFPQGKLNSIGPIPAEFVVDQKQFVLDNFNDILVAPTYGTSVNHSIAQYRAISGNDVWHGRTIQEAAALQYGGSFPIPNVNMAVGGFTYRGVDHSLPSYCYSERVTSPLSWASSLDGGKGIKNLPSRSLIEKANTLRNTKVDSESVFYQTFQKSNRVQRWLNSRNTMQPTLESANLINKLMFAENSGGIAIEDQALAAKLRSEQYFGNYAVDNLDAQAALAFLLLKHRVSNVVTIGNSFSGEIVNDVLYNPPIGFDFSHTEHRRTQLFLWGRIYSVFGKLIRLLKEEDLWKRTIIYVATDFGRDKERPVVEQTALFGTGHHLNNAAIIISPMLQGNQVLGGLNPQTGETYGLNSNGDPDISVAPPDEQSVYALLAQLLKLEATQGLPAVPNILRS